jgi:hypothetical protein
MEAKQIDSMASALIDALDEMMKPLSFCKREDELAETWECYWNIITEQIELLAEEMKTNL